MASKSESSSNPASRACPLPRLAANECTRTQLAGDLGGGVAGPVVDDENVRRVRQGGETRRSHLTEDGRSLIGGHQGRDAQAHAIPGRMEDA